jgi:predicted TIM-barrel fold metal-dependent hydrolase
MIIDAHGHTDEYEMLGWIDPPERVVALMDLAGIDLTLVTTYGEAPMYPAVDKLVGYIKKFPDRLLGFVRVNPRGGDEAVEAVEYAATFPEIRGIKFHPVTNNMKAYNKFAQKVIRRATELGLAIFSHCGDKVCAQPFEIGRGALMCPEAKIICHMGGFFHGSDSIRMAQRCPNVYLDTSSVPYVNLIRTAIDTLGPDRIVFATDNPAGDPISDLAKIKNLGLPKDVEDKILYKNIAGILNLETVRGVPV